MKYNELQTITSKGKKRVGRGIASGSGKTAGRGTKGQGARSGKKLHPTFEGGQNSLISAIPKKRGFTSRRVPAQVVYSDHLNALSGKTVDNMALFEAGMIGTPFYKVKIIARGEVTEKISLRTQSASKSVVAAIKKAGGSFEKVDSPLPKSQKAAEEAK